MTGSNNKIIADRAASYENPRHNPYTREEVARNSTASAYPPISFILSHSDFNL
jgi:hypothetical protein